MNQILDLWDNLPARHSMLVHLPVVFGMLGVVPLIALAVGRFRSDELRWVCLVWFLVLSAGAGLAAAAGEEAHEFIEDRIELTAQAEEELEEHEELGKNGWIWPLIPAALVAVTFVPRKKVRVSAGVIAVIASFGVATWITLTASKGGRLVHVHGLNGTISEAGSLVLSPAQPGRDRDNDDDH